MCREGPVPPRGHCLPAPPCASRGLRAPQLLPTHLSYTPSHPNTWNSLRPGPLLGLHCAPKSYVEVLTFSASKCHWVGKQGG